MQNTKIGGNDMTERLTKRMNSDTAESLTVSQILWIVFTVVLVLFVGQLLYKAISSKGAAVADCIEKSNTLFNQDGSQCANKK